MMILIIIINEYINYFLYFQIYKNIVVIVGEIWIVNNSE